MAIDKETWTLIFPPWRAVSKKNTKKIQGGKKVKKTMIIALVAAFVLSIAGSAFAAPLTFDGQASVQYREDTAKSVAGENDAHNTIYKLVINGKGESFIPNTDFYFRIGAVRVTNSDPNVSGGDFNKELFGTSHMAIDQFGFIYKNAGWNYKLGRQDAVVGATGLLFDNTANIGRYKFVDGLIVSGKAGVADIVLAGVQADSRHDAGVEEPRVYVAAANFALTKDFKLGATFAKVANAGNDANKNIWAVNTSYAFGKATFAAEYAKADVNVVGTEYDKAYDYGISYNFDSKNSVSVTAFKVEDNADVLGATTFDCGYKGMYYGFNHKFDKTTSLDFFYKDVERVTNHSMKNTSFRTTVSYKF